MFFWTKNLREYKAALSTASLLKVLLAYPIFTKLKNRGPGGVRGPIGPPNIQLKSAITPDYDYYGQNEVQLKSGLEKSEQNQSTESKKKEGNFTLVAGIGKG